MDKTTSQESERRTVTILWADLVGFTAISERLDSEDVVLLINQIFQLFGEIIGKHGGTIDKFMGDATMALFGAPKAHSDDAFRAVSCAATMQKALKEQYPDMNLKVAITTGEVICGWMGSQGQKGYTVIGDRVNVAARMEKLCQGGDILIDQNTHHLVKDNFLWQAREPVLVKGKEKPIAVFQYAGERTEKVLASEIFLKRQAFSALGGLWEAAKEGKSCLCLVRGDRGVGKSTLLRDLVKSQPHGASYAFFRRVPQHRETVPYLVIHLWLRLLFSIGVADPPKEVERKIRFFLETHFRELNKPGIWETLLSLCLRSGTAAAEETGGGDEMGPAFGSFLEALSREAPVILAYESFHWLDSGTLQLLKNTLERLPKSRILIAGSMPDDDPELKGLPFTSMRETLEAAPCFRSFALTPLSQAETQSYLSIIFPGARIPSKNIALLHKKSRGNFLHLSETVSYLKQKGLTIEKPLPEDILPAAIGSALQARLDELGEEELTLLRHAAIQGLRFDVEHLTATLSKSPEALLPSLKQLEELGIIQDVSRDKPRHFWEFRHPMMHQVAYNNILKTKRRELHKILADYIEDKNPDQRHRYAELLALHFFQAQEWKKAVRYLRLSAEVAQGLGSQEVAIGHYQKTLQAIEAVEQDEDWKAHQAMMSHFQIAALYRAQPKEIENALSHLRQAIDLAKSLEDHSTLSRAALSLGEVLTLMDQKQKAEEAFQMALRHAARSTDASLEVQIVERLSSFYLEQQDFDRALSLLRKHLEDPGLLRSYFSAYLGKGLSFAERGQWREALSIFDEFSRFKSDQVPKEEMRVARWSIASVLMNLGAKAFEAGSLAEARDNFKRALTLAEELGQAANIQVIQGWLARVEEAESAISTRQAPVKRVL